jgi:hypothetical protein
MQAAEAEVKTLHERREAALRQSREDPLRYGFEPETFALARAELAASKEVLVTGANREGKSTFCYKYVVEKMLAKEGCIAGIFEMSEDSSINKQHGRIFEMLPPEWRTLNKQGKFIDVTYRATTGFANGRFMLPNRSKAYFMNYRQPLELLEGYEFDIVLFEENVPFNYLDTMRFRSGNKDRIIQILYNFTPKYGFTPAVKAIMSGMRVLQTARAPLLAADVPHVKGCPPGHMPVLMANRAERRSVVFFHNGTNPMGGGEEVARTLVGATPEKIKIRAYGWIDKPMKATFGKYGAVHKITRAAFNELAAKGGLRGMAVDLRPNKNWFIKWYFVTPHNHTIVYREWPDKPRYDAWAEPGDKVDWRPGPAQTAELGKGWLTYKKLILEIEGARWDKEKGAWDRTKAEPMERRFMDPRSAGDPVPGQDEGTTILAKMNEEQLNDQGQIVGPAMDFELAPASGVEDTIGMIVERMDYNDAAPLTLENCPKWYIVEDLAQTDTAYQEWTGANSAKCALKDILDPDRYWVKADVQYYPPGSLATQGGGCF